jgi:uncharacterized protein YlzI (FlbEa/FlbD family)
VRSAALVYAFFAGAVVVWALLLLSTWALAGITLVELHAPNGHPVEINPAEVSSLREPVDEATHHWFPGTRCIIVMSNGRFYAVAENCEAVKEKLE